MIFKFLLVAVFVNAIAAQVLLDSGHCLNKGERLQSTNGCHRLLMQTDGNLVLYRKVYTDPRWHTGTSGSCTERACMQEDGNFVTYDCNNKPTWHSGTITNIKSRLVMQEDGNLVIYEWNSDKPIWSTNTVSGTQC